MTTPLLNKEKSMNETTQRRRSLRWSLFVFGLMLIAMCVDVCSAQALLGEIYLVPYNFSPVGFAECNGQLLSISQNTALFSLLGTTYGGDGITTFALPDLRDRVPVGAGQAPGLSAYLQGQTGGESRHVLTIAEMPTHTHVLLADSGEATSAHARQSLFTRNAERVPVYAGEPTTAAGANAIGNAGGGAAHTNLQPYLGLKYIIALQGVYPPRN
jgi:microcystin-dependent protein